MQAFVNPGDEVILFEPFYDAYRSIFQDLNCRQFIFALCGPCNMILRVVSNIVDAAPPAFFNLLLIQPNSNKLLLLAPLQENKTATGTISSTRIY